MDMSSLPDMLSLLSLSDMLSLSSSGLTESQLREQELMQIELSLFMMSLASSEVQLPPGGGRIVSFMPSGDRIVSIFIPSADSENQSGKDGVSPASKEAIASMPVVKISDEEEEGECAICLTEYCTGEEVKEMPCKHRYHSGCIDKWLGMHGSCPVCRHEMPTEKETERGERVPLYMAYVFRPESGESESRDNSEGSRESNGSSTEE